jgi:hypothetical protein
MAITSNIDEVALWISGIVDSVDFTSPGRDGSLGKDLAGVVAEGIIDRSVPDAVDPSGSRWAPNEERYAAYKREKFAADQPGILSGQMLSLESVTGQLKVMPDMVEMHYGTGSGASRSRTGAALSESQQSVSDRDKARYFADSGREFYALDERISEALASAAQDAVDDLLGRK